MTSLAPWLLLALSAAGSVPVQPFSALLLCCAAALWLLPAVFRLDLLRPLGLGAWSLWAAGLAASSFLGREPLISAQAWWPRATGILVLALGYSWWDRPHRRAWLVLLWLASLAAAAAMAATGSVPQRFLAACVAAAGSAAGVLARDRGGEEAARWGARALLAALLAAGAWGLWSRPSVPGDFLRARTRAWSQAAGVVADHPARGRGAGRVAAGSQPLTAAAENGVLSAALLLAAIGFSLPRRSDLLAREWERRGASGAAWGLAGFSLFSDLFADPALILLWFTALACSAQGSDEQEPRPFRLPPAAAAAGAAACLLCAAPSFYVERALRSGSLESLRRAALIAPAHAELLAALAAAELRADPPQAGRALWRSLQAKEASIER